MKQSFKTCPFCGANLRTKGNIKEALENNMQGDLTKKAAFELEYDLEKLGFKVSIENDTKINNKYELCGDDHFVINIIK